MHYFEYPSVDTTLYQASQSLNTGLDAILEVRKDVSPTGATVNVSRILIKFDLTYISSSIVNGTMPNPSSSMKFYLNMYDANPTELTTSDTLYAYPVSGSFTGGTGEFASDPQIKDGASWKYRNGESTDEYWLSGSLSSSGAPWSSGSFTDEQGGTRFLVASHSFDHTSEDMRMDVTDIMNALLTSGSLYPNNGFLVKRSGSLGTIQTTDDEGSTDRLGNLSFFSSDTHTKYPPTLEIEYDDSVWDTGSLSPLSSTDIEDLVIYMKGLRPEYKEKSRAKFRVVGRERYPEKTFDSTPTQLGVKYLPSGSSYYSVRDADTEEVLVPFGSGSKLSCDVDGNFFNLNLNAFQPERVYKLQFKATVSQSTSDEHDVISDKDFTFKVSR